MAVTDKVGNAGESAQELTDEQREKATEAAEEQLEQAEEGAEGAAEGAESAMQATTDAVKSMAKEGTMGMVSTVVAAAREAATEVLEREARAGAKQAAEYLSKKAPELAQQKLADAGGGGPMAQAAVDFGKSKLEGAGGGKAAFSAVGGALKGVAEKVMGGGGGGGGKATGYGKGRRMPVQQDLRVAVSVQRAFNGWTEYKRWGEYMHRVNQVDPQMDDESVKLKVTEKMWGFTRPFTAEIVDQTPDEFIRWKSVDGTKHTGFISFHELGPRLTLISVNLDHGPSGPIEKIARGARFVKRAVRADMHRFKGWIELMGEQDAQELEGWRGTIEDGEITQSHEDALAQEEESEDEAGQATDADAGDDAARRPPRRRRPRPTRRPRLTSRRRTPRATMRTRAPGRGGARRRRGGVRGRAGGRR